MIFLTFFFCCILSHCLNYEGDFKSCIESIECIIGDSPISTSGSNNPVLDTDSHTLKSSDNIRKLLTIAGQFTIIVNTNVYFTISDLNVCICYLFYINIFFFSSLITLIQLLIR
jgi:hypothetical protein